MNTIPHDSLHWHRGHFWFAAGALALFCGGLLTLGCERRDATTDVSAAAVREDARVARATESDYMKQQIASLESEVAQAQRDAQKELEQARAKSDAIPVAAREKLSAAIERTEGARANVGERLDELKSASESGWDSSRKRVVEALEELNEARRDVVAAFAGEPTTTDAS
jgi:hypothetical protein